MFGQMEFEQYFTTSEDFDEIKNETFHKNFSIREFLIRVLEKVFQTKDLKKFQKEYRSNCRRAGVGRQGERVIE